MRGKPKGEGFTYLGLLFALSLAGVALALAGVVWHTAGKRAKEEQLLFAGSAIRDAIVNYRRRSLDGNLEYPRTLQDLIEDRRYITVERHLRKIYPDPMAANRDWGLITSVDGRIVGVHSLSGAEPMKRNDFLDAFASFAQARHYSDWKFSAVETQSVAPDRTAEIAVDGSGAAIQTPASGGRPPASPRAPVNR